MGQLYQYLKLPYFQTPQADGTTLAEEILSAGGDYNLYIGLAIIGAILFGLIALKVKQFAWGSMICVGLAVWFGLQVRPLILAAAKPHVDRVEAIARPLFSQPLDGKLRAVIIMDNCIKAPNEKGEMRCCLADPNNFTVRWEVDPSFVATMDTVKRIFGHEVVGLYLGGRDGSRLYGGLSPSTTELGWAQPEPVQFQGYEKLIKQAMAREIPTAESRAYQAQQARDTTMMAVYRNWLSFLRADEGVPSFEEDYFIPGLALWSKGYWDRYCLYKQAGYNGRAKQMYDAAVSGKAGGFFHATVWIEPPLGFTWGNMAPKPLPLPEISKVVTPYRWKMLGESGAVDIFGEYTESGSQELIQ
jgi:hypothetical protein